MQDVEEEDKEEEEVGRMRVRRCVLGRARAWCCRRRIWVEEASWTREGRSGKKSLLWSILSEISGSFLSSPEPFAELHSATLHFSV